MYIRAALRHLNLVFALVLIQSALVWSGSVTVSVNTSAPGPPVGVLVGAGIEDVNNELYGGLYSQMLYGESFEEPASNGVSGNEYQVPFLAPIHDGSSSRPTWMPWSPTGTFNVSSDAINGKQSQVLHNAAIANFGLGQQGMHFVAGRGYEGYVHVKALGDAIVTFQLILDGFGAREVVGSTRIQVSESKAWQRFNFELTPKTNATCTLTSPEGPTTPRAGVCGYFVHPIPELTDDKTPGPFFKTCYQCSGGFVIEASGAPVLIDAAFLQPSDWGRWRGLPVRRDVSEAMFEVAGLKAVRLGGSMCNAAGYRWKNFRAKPATVARPPYAGFWHPFASGSFRMFETLEFCESANVYCVITVNSDEAPQDMSDFVEYCYGDSSTEWGSKRISDGRLKPYEPFTVEIGNEQPLSEHFLTQVQTISQAMAAKAKAMRLPFTLRVAVGQNIDLNNFNPSQGLLNLTLRMLDVLEPFGANAAWDAHIGGDDFQDSDDFLKILQTAKQVFESHGSETKLVVFEENGYTHNLQRALVHARMHVAGSYFGGFFLMDTAANGLQVFGQNDNGWDQGQVFMTPDKAWLSPFGWSQSMLSTHSQEFNRPLAVSEVPKGLDVGAYISDEGWVGLRVVNWRPTPMNLTVLLNGHPPTKPTMEVVVLTSGRLTDVNPPHDPRRVSPRKSTDGSLRVHGDGVVLDLALPANSFSTVALRPTSALTIEYI